MFITGLSCPSTTQYFCIYVLKDSVNNGRYIGWFFFAGWLDEIRFWSKTQIRCMSRPICNACRCIVSASQKDLLIPLARLCLSGATYFCLNPWCAMPLQMLSVLKHRNGSISGLLWHQRKIIMTVDRTKATWGTCVWFQHVSIVSVWSTIIVDYWLLSKHIK